MNRTDKKGRAAPVSRVFADNPGRFTLPARNAASLRAGGTFITVLVALLILAVGVVSLLRVFPVIEKLSGRASSYVSLSLVADRIFVILETVYGSECGPPVPAFFEGTDDDFSRYRYAVSLDEEMPGLYMVEVKITRQEEGKSESEYFYGSFRRR